MLHTILIFVIFRRQRESIENIVNKAFDRPLPERIVTFPENLVEHLPAM